MVDNRPNCQAGEAARCAEPFVPVERRTGRLDAGVLLLCDHASNGLPESYGTLGHRPGSRAPHRL